MIELTSPPLKSCPFCCSEPESERGYDWNDLSKTFLHIKCTQCGHRTHWVEYDREDLSSLQHAIDETSQWWNDYEISDDDDD